MMLAFNDRGECILSSYMLASVVFIVTEVGRFSASSCGGIAAAMAYPLPKA
jgi:hypothetical protein